ncbi:hypothetical protein C8R44DRAFT_766684 [Mycena epipterygia]|nr:hypothetical protein C8R44DRAFT_766684 [Mycena epipterygia]
MLKKGVGSASDLLRAHDVHVAGRSRHRLSRDGHCARTAGAEASLSSPHVSSRAGGSLRKGGRRMQQQG